jgi:outer membrane protein, multidrug efflux system
LGLSGCALQPPAATPLPLPSASEHWFGNAAARQVGPPSAAAAPQEAWWLLLGDNELTALVAAAQEASPTLASALARLDEARAQAGVAQATAGPNARVDDSWSRSASGAANTAPQSSLRESLSLSWDLDLFGRLRHNQAAAQQRLLSREADATSTRLALQAEVADTVLAQRACQLQALAQSDDLRSRQRTLDLTALRQSVGQVAPLETARARSGLAEAQRSLISTREQCAHFVNGLVALTGQSAQQVLELLAQRPLLQALDLPSPPATTLLGLPAQVLAQHPSVVSALRSAEAAFEASACRPCWAAPGCGLRGWPREPPIGR